MNRSLYTKLVLIIIFIIIALTVVTGVFLTRGGRSFYLNEFYDRMQEVFAAMGTNIRYMGGAGCGQHTKMANQIAIAGAVAGVCEALAYAKAAGLDLQGVLDAISTGAAGSWQMSNVCPKMMAEDYAPGFFLKHFTKDMTIAASQIRCPGL